MAQQTPPQLTPAALFEDQYRLDALRLETYNRILSTVQQKIRFTSTLPGSPQMTYFDIPEWQPGCPRFDVKDCILYIVWNLRHAGFKVMYVSPNRLLINWREQTVQYYQEDSPIRQAMMAAAAARPATASSATATASASAKPEKKKAASYKPATEAVTSMLASGPSRKATGGAGTITFI